MTDALTPVVAVARMFRGLLRKMDGLDDLDPEDLLERFAAPGTLDYWRSLTDTQLDPLRGPHDGNHPSRQ